MSFEMHGYPTDDALHQISHFFDDALIDAKTIDDFVLLVWDNWSPMGTFLRDEKCLKLTTGGWSGNEDVIGAMQENFLFWGFCWHKSQRGGAYWFDLSKVPKVEYSKFKQEIPTDVQKVDDNGQ